MVLSGGRSSLIFSLIAVLSIIAFLHAVEVVPATRNFGALLSHKVIIVRNQAGMTVEGQRRFT